MLVLVLVPLTAVSAQAAVGAPTMYSGHRYSTSATAATADKPQSKLWFNDGSWWALMVTAAGSVNVFELQDDHTWRDTGTVVDERAASTGDALWADGKLYVVSRTGGSRGQVRIYRYSFAPGSRTYSRDAGFPVTPAGTGGTESATIAQDSLDRLWITFTRASKVYVAHSTTSDTVWTAPFRISGVDTDVSADDLSAVVTLPGKIGVMWSDQASDAFRFAIHLDTDADTVWSFETPLAGTRMVDDHINLKSLAGDDQGRVHAAVKTSKGDGTSDLPSDPSIVVLSRGSDGTWTSAQAAAVSDGLTRPQLALDVTNDLLFLMQSTESGGAVYLKSSPLDAISFGPGRGDTLMSASGARINDASTTKDPVDASTGLVAIASDAFARRYYHSEMSLGTVVPVAPTAGFTATPSTENPLTVQFSDTSSEGPTSWAWDFGDGATSTEENPAHTYAGVGEYTVSLTVGNAAGTGAPVAQVVTVEMPEPPVAGFTAAPASGIAPLAVLFTDTSSGGPVSWAWDFGDGTTSTEQNPSHTFAAGTYTVSLTATNAGGTSTAFTQEIRSAAPGPGVAEAGSTSAVSAVASSVVTLAKPADASAGDVLVASFTVDNTPAVSVVPAGWTSFVPPSSPSAASLFGYYRVVSEADAGTASWSWSLSAAQKWNGGMARYTGVDTGSPFDTTVSAATNLAWNATSVSVPGVTTVTPGAMLIGGSGANGVTPSTTPPAGWELSWEATGGQVAAHAFRLQPAAGATGNLVWTISEGRAVAAWVTALRPAPAP